MCVCMYVYMCVRVIIYVKIYYNFTKKILIDKLRVQYYNY